VRPGKNKEAGVKTRIANKRTSNESAKKRKLYWDLESPEKMTGAEVRWQQQESREKAGQVGTYGIQNQGKETRKLKGSRGPIRKEREEGREKRVTRRESGY